MIFIQFTWIIVHIKIYTYDKIYSITKVDIYQIPPQMNEVKIKIVWVNYFGRVLKKILYKPYENLYMEGPDIFCQTL